MISLGDIAAGECARHNIEHIAVCHPSRRGNTNERNATEIAEAIAALGFRGVVKDGRTQDDRKSNSRNEQLWNDRRAKRTFALVKK